MRHLASEHELVAGAALGDLSTEERLSYLEHRASCGDCLVLELQLDHVLADLSLLVPERVPPPDLYAGIRSAIAADRTGVPATSSGSTPSAVALPVNVVPIRQRTSRGATRSATRSATFAAVGLAAVLGIVAVGLGARATVLSDELARTESALARVQSELSAQGAVMVAAVNPDHVTAPLQADAMAPDASAFVVYVPGTTESYLVAHGLPATPDGHGYQLWYADEAGVHGLGTFSHDGSGAFVAPFSVDLASSAAAMLTLEPTGGAVGEPGPQVVFGELYSEG
jgi:hypothetical protein